MLKHFYFINRKMVKSNTSVMVTIVGFFLGIVVGGIIGFAMTFAITKPSESSLKQTGN